MSNQLSTLLRHGHLPREDDIFGTILCDLDIGLMKSGRVQWQWRRKKEKYFNVVLILQVQFCTSELFKVISGRNLFDPSLQENVVIPDGFFKYIYHIGCAINLRSIMHSGLIPGGQILSKRQTVFFTSVDPTNKEHKDPDTIDLGAPRLAWYMHKARKKYQNTVFWG